MEPSVHESELPVMSGGTGRAGDLAAPCGGGTGSRLGGRGNGLDPLEQDAEATTIRVALR